MRFYFILILACCFVLTVCTDEKSEPKVEMEELPPEPGPYELEIDSVFAQIDSSFKADAVEEVGTTKTETFESFPLSKSGVEEFLPVLLYSYDSSYAIDPYSYNYILEYKSTTSGSFSDAGPDSEVALVNLKDSTRKRIWFAGPSIVLLKAGWLDRNRIAIAAAELTDDNQGIPIIEVINIQSREVLNYRYNDTLLDINRDKLKEELKTRWDKIVRTTRAS